ncbi:UDP-glucose--hexose-1-phosphate uridylyltransferase [Virgibacillus soli]|uniref:UDP-glucose--hexose-1-phosphate uridylyltransferase n=1 Tax=Paracerasibacillus soli TaxID=480284 RepID=UPI0035EDA582
MTIFEDVAGLIQQAKEVHLIETQDEVYVRNQVLHLLQIASFPKEITTVTSDTIPNLLEKIIDYAIQNHVIEDIFDDKEILSAKIMNCFIPHPSVLHDKFYHKYKESPQAATDFFYELSKNSNYIQMNRIAKNVHFKADTAYGELDITINLSKPEKDPEQIKREREMKQTLDYPQCVLCRENEGYVGRIGYPARANHRVMQVPLLNENWYLQYSPYVYYNEHSIVFSEEHRDMKINKNAFERLLTFVDKFPHYFIGSNADLPIVGGSILSHDHYQAGRYEFAMTNAKDAFNFELKQFPDVSAAVLNWPMSVIRLRGKHKEHIVHAADHIFHTWKQYTDERVDIIPFTDQTPHNTVTPIARFRNGEFELDLVLRNNRTTAEFPMGIFHPHADVHHIKKENIGLIEVMGLAVLPARLKEELQEIKNYLVGSTHSVADYHLEWAEQLKSHYGILTNLEQAEFILQKELGLKFAKVLAYAGVFKQTTAGRDAFRRFIRTLN